MMDILRRIPAYRQVAGHWHPAIAQQRPAHPPIGEIGKADEGPAPGSDQFGEHQIGPLGGLQRLAEHGIIEAVIGIIDQIAVGIALDHAEPACDAGLDQRAVDLDPANVAAPAQQRRHQRAVAAADIEHAGARLDMRGDDREVGAQMGGYGGAHSRKPFTTRSSAGTSSRKLSWPKGAESSTKLTGAPAALSAWTTWRLSAVG